MEMILWMYMHRFKQLLFMYTLTNTNYFKFIDKITVIYFLKENSFSFLWEKHKENVYSCL